MKRTAKKKTPPTPAASAETGSPIPRQGHVGEEGIEPETAYVLDEGAPPLVLFGGADG